MRTDHGKMFASSTLIFTCLIISVAAETNSSEEIPNPQPNPQPSSQPKYGDVFSQTTAHGVQLAEIPGETDFLEYTIKLLGSAEDNTTRVSSEILKYFPAGLDQYYLAKAYEYYFANATPSNESYTDGPATYMPNATYENIEFYQVTVNGFPGFKKNAQIYQTIDGSPFIKNYTIHFNATADVTFIIGDFKIDDEQYCFCYQALKNIYTTRVNVIRTNSGLPKPQLTIENFAAQREEFVHTYDSTQENYTSVNASIHSKFQEAFQEVYMPKLGTYIEGILKQNFTNASAKFSELYRLRLRETLFKSARKYLSSLGNATYTFSTLNMTRDTPIPGVKAVYTYTATINGYLDFESYEFNSSQAVANGTSLLMYDVVTLHYPQHASNMTVEVKDDRNVSFVETFEIRSFDIMIAYEADLSSTPVRVHPDLEKFKYLQMGFFSEFKFWHINPFYDFIRIDAQVEFAKLINNLFKSDGASSN